MRNTKVIVFLILAFGLLFFGCKTQEKKAEEELDQEQEQEVVEETEEAIEEEVVEGEKTREVEGYNVFFAPDSYSINKLTAAKLRLLVGEVRKEGPTSIRIVGHSAQLDSEKEEEKISLRRAMAVAEYLDSMGLLEGLTVSGVEGVGSKEPAFPHSDITARGFNRRVEIKIEE